MNLTDLRDPGAPGSYAHGSGPDILGIACAAGYRVLRNEVSKTKGGGGRGRSVPPQGGRWLTPREGEEDLSRDSRGGERRTTNNVHMQKRNVHACIYTTDVSPVDLTRSPHRHVRGGSVRAISAR